MLQRITPVILTFNEEANIARTLARLEWADDIVVVDSFSTDATLSIVSATRRARVFQRGFDTHAQQWNFAIGETAIRTDWVLALDADYLVPEPFVAELCGIDLDGKYNGYAADFVYCVMGRPLRGSLYPKVTLLYRREVACYAQYGHTQRVKVDGAVGRLAAKVLHDDRKPLGHWFAAQQRYARLEAMHLLATSNAELRWTDRIRAMAWPAPALVFFYSLLVKRCLFDGWPGWLYVLQRTCVEIMIALELIDKSLRAGLGEEPPPKES